jgi:hypothetical protein
MQNKVGDKINLISSNKIKKLEKELEKKKVCQNEINIKYKSLVEIVMKCIEDDHLNFVLVMALLQKAEENKCCL